MGTRSQKNGIGSKKILKLIGVLIVAGLAWYGREYLPSGDGATKTPDAVPAPGTGGPAVVTETREGAIERAYKEGRSDTWVEVTGRIKKNLPDDLEGSRHQKMIVTLGSGHTILIAHNIDLAPRVPCDEGDTIRFRGEYEWTEQGGTVHWTHHDPQGRHEDGWIEHEGKLYK